MSLAILLIVTPKLGSEAARHWIIAMSIVTYGFAAIANAWATRGRHFGWVAMIIVIGLAAIGVLVRRNIVDRFGREPPSDTLTLRCSTK